MEIEYKWELPDEDAVRRLLADAFVANHMTSSDVVRMHSTYYDTPAQDVHRLHGGLRIRRENDKSVCCLKLSAKNQDACKTRREYEVEAADIREGLEKLPQVGAPRDICELLLKGDPQATCETDFTREAKAIVTDAFTAELALDRGELGRLDKRAPICEVELEYKSGSVESFHEFAARLQNGYGLVVQPLSKLARAITL